MQEIVKEVLRPKGRREQLDELEIGENIPLKDVKEVQKFSTERYRSFHSKKSKSSKRFVIKTDPVTEETAIYRLK